MWRSDCVGSLWCEAGRVDIPGRVGLQVVASFEQALCVTRQMRALVVWCPGESLFQGGGFGAKGEGSALFDPLP